MIRHEETTQIFRKVARKGWTEHLIDAPNAASYLEELAGKIIDKQVTTGDELIDSLVAWYGKELTRETIDRFNKLDTGLNGVVGQAALVVSRKRSNRKPFRVDATYDVGIVNGEGLVCDLMKGRSYIPTESHVSVGGMRGVVQEARPVVVTNIYACGYDDEYRFLAYGTPDLAMEHSVDARIKKAFVAEDYATPLDAAESRQPNVQVFVGTECVRDFLGKNEVARAQFAKLEATEPLGNLLNNI